MEKQKRTRKRRDLYLSDEHWELAKEAADQSNPKTTRPLFIESAIEDKAKKSKVKK